MLLMSSFKKETLGQAFPCEFCEISKNTFFTEHSERPLLEMVIELLAVVCITS